MQSNQKKSHSSKQKIVVSVVAVVLAVAMLLSLVGMAILFV